MTRLINHNGLIQEEGEFKISPFNRGLSFGDGFFESCLFEQGQCKLWIYHKKRIEIGFTTLKFQKVSFDILQEVEQLLKQALLLGSMARVKIVFYRAGEGAYTPSTNTCEYLISATAFTPDLGLKQHFKCGLANQIYVHSGSNAVKLLSSFNYVRATIEKRERRLNDLILLNEHGYVAETTASNIWWVVNEVIYTPSVNCGGVEGVFKSKLIEFLNDDGITLKQGEYSFEDLLAADEVFITNAVQGIRTISQIDDRYFKGQMTHYLNDNLFA